jgi:hypothetical protein
MILHQDDQVAERQSIDEGAADFCGTVDGPERHVDGYRDRNEALLAPGKPGYPLHMHCAPGRRTGFGSHSRIVSTGQCAPAMT